MTISIAADPLPLRLDDQGTYRVGNSGVRLDTVVFAYKQGSSAEQIAREFPTLELADVHSVIAYYLHHRGDVDVYLEQRQREASQIRSTLVREGFVMPDAKQAEIRRRFEERQIRGA